MKILAIEIILMPALMFVICYEMAALGLELSMMVALGVGVVIAIGRMMLKKYFIKKGLLEQPKEQQSSTVYRN